MQPVVGVQLSAIPKSDPEMLEQMSELKREVETLRGRNQQLQNQFTSVMKEKSELSGQVQNLKDLNAKGGSRYARL